MSSIPVNIQEAQQKAVDQKKKRRNRRGGTKHQLHKIISAFDYNHRQTCSRCSPLPSSWSCEHCDRTLPNRKWSNLHLAAEDRNDSMFGRLRLMAGLLIFSKEDEAFFYGQAQDLMRCFATDGILSKIEDPARQLEKGQFPEATWQPPVPGWKWSYILLSAEDQDNSIIGVFGILLKHGRISHETMQNWVWLGRSIGKTWVAVLASASATGTVLSNPVDVTALRAKCPDDNLLVDFSDKIGNKEVFEIIRGLAAEADGFDEDHSKQEPKASEDGATGLGTLSRKRHLQDPNPQMPGKSLVGASPEGKISKKDLSNFVQAHNTQLKLEESKKEEIKKERQAKKDQIKAKKAQRKNSQRKRSKRTASQGTKDTATPGGASQLHDSENANQAQTTGLSWDESLMDGLMPLVSEGPQSPFMMASRVQASPEVNNDHILAEVPEYYSGLQENNELTGSSTVADTPGTAELTSQSTEVTTYPTDVDSSAESIIGRINQLSANNFLSASDYHIISQIRSDLATQYRAAIQDDPLRFDNVSLPNRPRLWKWAHLNLSREDEEGSDMLISRKLVLLGYRSENQHRLLEDLAMRLAKLWLSADSSKDIVGEEYVSFPWNDSERRQNRQTRNVTFSNNDDIRYISPAPDVESLSNSNSEQAASQVDVDNESTTDEEKIVFKPRSRY
ncbi:hypothetical protein ACLMJK_004238 [Lecanora helva]